MTRNAASSSAFSVATWEGPTMADDTGKRDYRDRDRINRDEPYEVEYWAKTLGVSKAQLLTAIDKAGVMVKDVRRQLGK